MSRMTGSRMTGSKMTGLRLAGGLWIKRCSQFVAVMIVIGLIAVIGISPAAAQPEDLPAGPGLRYSGATACRATALI